MDYGRKSAIFISHSSIDIDLISKLINLFSAAFGLQKKEIFCTSVDGSGTQGGQPLGTVLDQIRKAKIFIPVITPSSFESHAVWVEIGVRWAGSKCEDLIPIKTCDRIPTVFNSLLQAITILDVRNSGKIHALVEQVSKALRKPLSPQSYHDELELFRNLAVRSGSEFFSAKDVRVHQNQTVYICSRLRDGFCLGIKEGSSKMNSEIVLQELRYENHQKWNIEPLEDYFFRIVSAKSKMCLDVCGSSSEDGASIIQHPPQGHSNQLWSFVPQPGGFFQIIAKHSQKCLDVFASHVCDGARISQFFPHENFNQQWFLLPTMPSKGGV